MWERCRDSEFELSARFISNAACGIVVFFASYLILDLNNDQQSAVGDIQSSDAADFVDLVRMRWHFSTLYTYSSGLPLAANFLVAQSQRNSGS